MHFLAKSIDQSSKAKYKARDTSLNNLEYKTLQRDIDSGNTASSFGVLRKITKMAFWHFQSTRLSVHEKSFAICL